MIECSTAYQQGGAMLSIRDVIHKHALTANAVHNKKLGQNFLCDVSCLAPHIPDLSAHHVWEVGPGPGGLTRLLLSRQPQAFTATEFDKACVEALSELHQPPLVNITHGNALHVVPQNVFPDPKASIVIAGNLPYNIGTTLLMQWLQDLTRIHSIYIMLQKEVVDRLVAQPRTKAYGRLSVVTQLCCNVQILVDLPPEWFVPQPRVFSSFVRLMPRQDRPTGELLKNIETLTQKAFSKRRKMLRQSIPVELIAQVPHVQESQRPEELSPATFRELAQLFS